MRYVSGWLLPAGAYVEPSEVLVPCDYRGIGQLIGADTIDAVRADAIARSEDSDKRVTLVGYVDDNGLFNNVDDEGDMDVFRINYLATALFGRTEPIMGDVVVVSGTSPSGVYDGDNYDLPAWFDRRIADSVVERAANMYNSFLSVLLSISKTVEDGLLTADEVNAATEHEDADQALVNIAEVIATSVNYVNMILEGGVPESGSVVDEIISGFENMLGEENK